MRYTTGSKVQISLNTRDCDARMLHMSGGIEIASISNFRRGFS